MYRISELCLNFVNAIHAANVIYEMLTLRMYMSAIPNKMNKCLAMSVLSVAQITEVRR